MQVDGTQQSMQHSLRDSAQPGLTQLSNGLELLALFSVCCLERRAPDLLVKLALYERKVRPLQPPPQLGQHLGWVHAVPAPRQHARQATTHD